MDDCIKLKDKKIVEMGLDKDKVEFVSNKNLSSAEASNSSIRHFKFQTK